MNVDDPAAGPAGIVDDLVGYLVLAVPDRAGLSAVVPALRSLVDREVIRILDLAVVVRDADGVVASLEVDDIESLDPLRHVEGEYGRLLTEHDLDRVAQALEPGTAAFVLVTEDQWAAPLSSAAHQVGGSIIAGERIPAARLRTALIERGTRGDEEG